jgi:hypothetical protein
MIARPTLALLCALSHAAASIAAPTPQPWSFVVSVGGMSVDDPVKVDGSWSLPVHADVSGLESFGVKPTALYSGLVCARVAAKIAGRAITLSLYTDVPGAAKDARCPAARLGAVAAGDYRVYYRGPDEPPVFLRSVRVE